MAIGIFLLLLVLGSLLGTLIGAILAVVIWVVGVIGIAGWVFTVSVGTIIAKHYRN